MLSTAHVEAGNTLDLLFHEASHLLGIGNSDTNHQQSSNFAADCVEALKIGEQKQVPSSGGGDEDGKDEGESDGESYCVVIDWYWSDTGVFAGREVLWCE